jgi:hypothetical protein
MTMSSSSFAVDGGCPTGDRALRPGATNILGNDPEENAGTFAAQRA